MRIFVLAVVSLACVLGGCGDDGGSSGTALSISPTHVTVTIGGTATVMADGVERDNVVWTSADPSIATVLGMGSRVTITGVAAGQVDINYEVDIIHGTVTATVTGPAVDSIAVSAARTVIPLGETEQLTAQGNTGEDITNSATWTSQDPAIASVDSRGLVTAHAVGATTILAGRDGAMGSLAIMVDDGELTSISVTPSTHALPLGLSLPLVASGTFADGTIRDVTAMAAWSTSDAAIATVSAAGVVQSLAVGSATITATVNGLSASSAIEVGAPVLKELTIGPEPLILLVNGTDQQLTVTASSTDGTSQDVTARVTWSVMGGAATVSAAGLAHAVAEGNATITAKLDGVTDTLIATVHQAVRLEVFPAPDVVDDVTIAQQQRVQLIARAIVDRGESFVDVTATASWTSSNPAVATVAAGQLDAQSVAGMVTVTATAAGFSVPVPVTVTIELCHPVINEVLTGAATPSDEWIELYNPCNHAVDVTGDTLVAHGPLSNSIDVPLVTLTGTMGPGTFRLYAGAGYTGTGAASADGVWPGSGGILVPPSFGVGLLKPASATLGLIDGVAFGTVVNNPFLEGSAAPGLIDGVAGARFGFDGRDSHDGHHDFSTLIPSPKAPN
jgi:uncharacterized protein YjdB